MTRKMLNEECPVIRRSEAQLTAKNVGAFYMLW